MGSTLIKSNQEEIHYVYFLVEINFFKVGVTKNIYSRSRSVSFNPCVEKSFYISFRGKNDAYECEKIIHWLFREYRHTFLRCGGTEFFKIECFENLCNIIASERHLIGFIEKLNINQIKNPESRNILLEEIDLSKEDRHKRIIQKIKRGELRPSIRAIKKEGKCDYATAAKYLSGMAAKGILERLDDGTYKLIVKRPKLKSVK